MWLVIATCYDRLAYELVTIALRSHSMSNRVDQDEEQERVELGGFPGVSPRASWFRRTLHAVSGGLLRTSDLTKHLSTIQVVIRLNLLIEQLSAARDRLLHGPPDPPVPEDLWQACVHNS